MTFKEWLSALPTCPRTAELERCWNEAQAQQRADIVMRLQHLFDISGTDAQARYWLAQALITAGAK